MATLVKWKRTQRNTDVGGDILLLSLKLLRGEIVLHSASVGKHDGPTHLFKKCTPLLLWFNISGGICSALLCLSCWWVLHDCFTRLSWHRLTTEVKWMHQWTSSLMVVKSPSGPENSRWNTSPSLRGDVWDESRQMRLSTPVRAWIINLSLKLH